MAAITYSNQDINRFWLNIMADNALIIYNAFSPANVEGARQAKEFADRFDNLVTIASQNQTGDQLIQTNTESFQAIQKFRIFLLELLNTMLTRKIHFDLKLEIINDMVNMAEYYIILLDIYMRGRQPVFNPILEDIFWMPMLLIQNRYITDNIGQYESMYREVAVKFTGIFTENWLGAMELQGFTRIGKNDFPIANEHHKFLYKITTEYYEYLANLVSLVENQRLLVPLSVLFLDRSRRLACFYLTNLSVINNYKKPDCDPYARRISSL